MELAVFDIGGTAVKTGLFVNGRLSITPSFPTPQSFADLQKEMRRRLNGLKLTGLAISAPGAVDVDNGIIRGMSAVPYLHKRPIFQELTSEFGLPVAIENDANCAGICEMQIGAGQPYQNVAFVVVGTGIGGAIFIDHKLYKGNHLFGGEFGFIKASSGHILSSEATIVQAAANYSQEKKVAAINGEELFALAEKGDTLAQELIEQVYRQLAQLLYDIQVAFGFDAIIIGGGVSQRPKFSQELSQRLFKQLDQFGLTEIMPHVLSCQYHNDANLYGAAYNFIANFGVDAV